MSSTTAPAAEDSEAPSAPRDGSSWTETLVLSPLLWGALLTVGFYSVIPYTAEYKPFLLRYFCGHWILYSTTALFAVALATLARKALLLPRERRALHWPLLSNPRLMAEPDLPRRARLLLDLVRQAPGHLRRTWALRRIHETAQYLSVRGPQVSLEDHLQYQEEAAASALHDSYAFIRTITWAVPILGFLGTVIGITMAIANITPDQLESSLSSVTAGLAVAFDTTALSLSLSMVIVFGTFLVERGEQRILDRVAHMALAELAPLFPPSPVRSPLEQAEADAAQQLLKRTEALVTWQTDLWQTALQEMRDRWAQTVAQQQTEFVSALGTGMSTTLTDHSRQLETVRTEFLNGFRGLTADLVRLVGELQESTQARIQTLDERLDQTAEAVVRQLAETQRGQAASTERLVATLETVVRKWETALAASQQLAQRQLEELHGQGEVLLRIVGQETELTRLEERLAHNLEAVRAAKSFDETLHSLTAAIHLLTIRNRAA